jgi:hypothetical protein
LKTTVPNSLPSNSVTSLPSGSETDSLPSSMKIGSHGIVFIHYCIHVRVAAASTWITGCIL